MKTILKTTAKTLGLIPVIDFIRSRVKGIKQAKCNRAFLKAHPQFIPPPLELAFDAYGHVDWNYYYVSGQKDAIIFGNLITEYAPSRTLNILDWGCGPARLLIHLPKILHSHKLNIYGTDYNPRTIKWCKEHLKNIHFAQNLLSPPLEFQSNKFEVIYSLSVLTHLSKQSHFDWINELNRLLKPSGILILTTHGDYFRNILSEDEKRIYDTGNLVVRDQINEGRRGYVTFHPPQFLRSELFKGFNILKHIDNGQAGSIKQDIWVIQKRI